MSDKEQDGMISCDDGNNEDTYVYSVEYAEDGQYLTGPDDKKIGPFMSIYLEDMSLMEKKDFIFRYIDKESGLIGYMDQDGNAMTEAIFTEASKVADGPAIVKEKTGGVYYIDRKSFKRISEDFLSGYEFEHQGQYARVQFEDGKYGIINENGEVVFKGAEKINPIPMVFCETTAIVDGHATGLSLPLDEGLMVNVLFQLEEECSDISDYYMGLVAVFTTKNGKQGVVDVRENILVPAEYKDIECREVLFGEDAHIEHNMEIICQKEDGTREVIMRAVR